MASMIMFFLPLVALVGAQTPQGFEPATNAGLDVTYANNVKVTPAGVLLPRSEVLTQPVIKLANGSSPTGTFMQFIVDIDVPTQSGAKSTFLHLAQTDLKAGAAGTSTTTTANNGTAKAAARSYPRYPHPYNDHYLAKRVAIASDNAQYLPKRAGATQNTQIEASYIPPTPPAGSGAHRYVVLMFNQPSNFSVPAGFATLNSSTSTQARGGFNIQGFAAATGLGAPIGATFFTVENTGNTTTAAAPAAAPPAPPAAVAAAPPAPPSASGIAPPAPPSASGIAPPAPPSASGIAPPAPPAAAVAAPPAVAAPAK